ncbi:amidase [Phlyctema vagabunda]|uniref:Amidase n=1 Tax=Phlyctema vagabunda TaxID=108571 RepID=A0ABR4PTS2_9HELO
MVLQILAVLALALLTSGAPLKRNVYSHLETTAYGDAVFELGNITYLANVRFPIAAAGGRSSQVYETSSSLVLFTVVVTEEKLITGEYLEDTIEQYLEADDVYTEDFLEGIYIKSLVEDSVLDPSALEYLANHSISRLFIDISFSKHSSNITGDFAVTVVETPSDIVIPAGPYTVSISTERIAFSSVFRLYPDEYRDFLYGTYDSNIGDGSRTAFTTFQPNFEYPMIPVPSRIYSQNDTRPMAGQRVAVKDLFDVHGLKTSAGSQAWAAITPVANGTAPCIQRIIDLGGIIVGKYKMAQFASGADPWDWQDVHYPWNPRGDGYLTCASSSSGGGCSIAAYDWLDFAIGSDTGSSMRRPAAVSGTYGNRPSQGMMDLTRVIPLGDATDTVGVFSRDPLKWVKFAKAWYSPGLHQDSSITGLPALTVSDTKAWPKRVLYPVDYFPMANPAAEALVQKFLGNLSQIFDMRVENFNLTSTLEAKVRFSQVTYALNIINSYHQYQVIVKPLVNAWKALYNGRFPPVDPQWRSSWRIFNETTTTATVHAAAVKKRAEAVAWSEENLLYATADSCSESMIILDIGTGGLPSFREQDLNTDNPAATFLAVVPPDALVGAGGICPAFGCADYTVPIGQVPYFSNVTFHTEFVPVTVNLAVNRGCDFMLFNMIEKLAQKGVLKTVKTGRTAF